MKITVKKEITIASFRKRISTSQIGQVFARFEGKASFSVETDESEKEKVELTISKEAELKINDLIFGASGAFKVSKDKVEFTLGTDAFDVTFEPFGLNPISIHLPSVKLPGPGQKFRLEKELPGLRLTGTAEIELEFLIDFIPNYGRLAKVVNAKTGKALLQATKNSLYKFGKATGTVGRLVIRAGRAAVYAPFNVLGNYIGRNLAMQSLTRLATSQVVQLRKLIGTLGKLVGAAGLLLEARRGATAIVEGALKASHEKVVKIVNEEFAESYAKTLAILTNQGPAPSDDFFDMTTKLKRPASEPPDVLGIIEHLSKAGEVGKVKTHAGDWVKDQISRGVKFKEETIVLAGIDWRSLYRESYNLYILFMAPSESKDAKSRTQAFQAFAVALQLIRGAGVIACYQDVLAFVGASSLYEDISTGSQPTDVWEGWSQVGAFHRAIFGEGASARKLSYRRLIDLASLKVSIPPFADYN